MLKPLFVGTLLSVTGILLEDIGVESYALYAFVGSVIGMIGGVWIVWPHLNK